MLQRLAADAEGLWLGTNVTLLPLHNPIELAEVGAFMDVITGGKFLLGVGLGYRPEEYEMYGVPMSERVSRFNEGVEIIAQAVDRGPASPTRAATGSSATPPSAPRPLQQPRAAHHHRRAGGGGHHERGATIGDGWLVVPIPTLDQLGQADGDLQRPRARPPSCRRARISAGCSRSAAPPTRRRPTAASRPT